MARSQRNSITILLGLEGYQVGGVKGDSKGIIVEVSTIGEEVNCPYCGGERLYKHGACPPRRALHSWSNGERIHLESIGSAGGAGIVVTRLMMVLSCCDLIPG